MHTMADPAFLRRSEAFAEDLADEALIDDAPVRSTLMRWLPMLPVALALVGSVAAVIAPLG